jgi:hypothetical protein
MLAICCGDFELPSGLHFRADVASVIFHNVYAELMSGSGIVPTGLPTAWPDAVSKANQTSSGGHRGITRGLKDWGT